MWQQFLKTTYKGSEQLVAVFCVLPADVWAEFKADIETWTAGAPGGSFNVNAAYNIVPVAFTLETAKLYKIPLASLDPKNDASRYYAGSYRKNLNIRRGMQSTTAEKCKMFVGFHSFYRESLNHYNDINALRIREFMQRGDLDQYFETNRKAVQDFHRPVNSVH